MKNDNLRGFHADWEHVLTGMNPMPADTVHETLFRIEISKTTAMRDILTYYSRLDMNHDDHCYAFLLCSVRRHFEQQRRTQTRQELQNSLSGQGAGPVLANTAGGANKRGTSSGGERIAKGHCRDWVKKGNCAKGNACAF